MEGIDSVRLGFKLKTVYCNLRKSQYLEWQAFFTVDVLHLIYNPISNDCWIRADINRHLERFSADGEKSNRNKYSESLACLKPVAY